MTTPTRGSMPALEWWTLEGEQPELLQQLGLPEATLRDFSRFTEPLERRLLVQRSGDRVTAAVPVLSRMLGAYLKVTTPWVNDNTDRVAAERALLAEVERRAWHEQRAAVKREHREHDRRWIIDDGYVELAKPTIPGPIPNPAPAITSADVKWRTQTAPTSIPYMRQTTEFTCGPAALLMAMAALGATPTPDRQTELALWREATTVLGCDPYGLAVAAAVRGLSVELTVTTDAYMLLEKLPNEQERELRRFIQAGFRERAAQLGIPVAVKSFGASKIAEILQRDRLAIVLIDELLFHGQTCPHWLLVHDADGDVFLAHDPWTEISAGESWVDGCGLPLHASALEAIARFGEPPYSAVLSLGWSKDR